MSDLYADEPKRKPKVSGSSEHSLELKNPFNVPIDTVSLGAVSRAGAPVRAVITVSPDSTYRPDLHGRMVAVPLPPGVTLSDFKQVLAVAHMEYRTTGRIPYPEVVAQKSGLKVKAVGKIMASEEWLAAAVLRGMALEEKTGLTSQQDFLLSILADPTLKSGLTGRLRAAKVSYSTYRNWMQQPVFREYYDKLTGSVLHDSEGAIMVALADNAVNGDLPSIKYALEVTGRHNPQAQNNADVREVMARVIGILQEELSGHPELATRIAMRLTNTSAAVGVPIKEITGG